MPNKIGAMGLPIVLHPHDPDRVRVFPRDGAEVFPRASPGGMPGVSMRFRMIDEKNHIRQLIRFLDDAHPVENLSLDIDSGVLQVLYALSGG